MYIQDRTEKEKKDEENYLFNNNPTWKKFLIILKKYIIISILWIFLYYSLFDFFSMSLKLILPEPPEYIDGDFDTSIYLPHIDMLFTIWGICFLILLTSLILYKVLKLFPYKTFKFMFIASFVFILLSLMSSFAFYILYGGVFLKLLSFFYI